MHYTDKKHPDYSRLLQLIELGESLLHKANQAAKEQENAEKIQEIKAQLKSDKEHSLDISDNTKLLGPREFIYEGPLFKVKSNRKIFGILFNDLLLLTVLKSNKISVYRTPLPLNEIAVRDSSETDLGIEIIHIHKKISLKCKSLSEKRTWINLIEEHSHRYLQAEKMLKEKSQPHFQFLATLNIHIIEARNLDMKPRLNPFCLVQVNSQKVQTKVIQGNADPRWNESLIISIASLDETVRITLYSHQKYSQNGKES